MSYPATEQEEHALNVLELAIKGDFTDALLWSAGFRVAINCNDLFVYGADAEGIYPADLRLLEDCIEDMQSYPEYLFVARKRRMRPLPGSGLGSPDLFDICGP